MTELDLRVPTPELLARALIESGPERTALLRAFAAAAKPADTIAYVEAALVPAGRLDVRAGRYLADLVWAEEPRRRSAWHLYRGLRLALVATDVPWLGVATLADLRAEHRLLAASSALPDLRDVDAFWRAHRHRRGRESLLLAEWDGERGRVWLLDGMSDPRIVAEGSRSGVPRTNER